MEQAMTLKKRGSQPRKQRQNKSKKSGKQGGLAVYNAKPVRPVYLRPDPIPAGYRSKVSYSYLGNGLDTVSDDFNFLRFKLNSINDPGLALTSNSAYTYLNLDYVYGNFIVLSSSICVELVNTDTDIPMRLSVTPTLDDPFRSPVWTADSIIINGDYSETRMVGNSTGQDRAKISLTLDVGKFAGVGRLSPKCYEYTGNTVGNLSGVADPVSLGCWIVALQALSTVTDNLNALLSVHITYDVYFYNYLMPYFNTPSMVKQEPVNSATRAAYYSKYALLQVEHGDDEIKASKEQKPKTITKKR
jgi:hypothetical protein